MRNMMERIIKYKKIQIQQPGHLKCGKKTLLCYYTQKKLFVTFPPSYPLLC